MLIDRSKSDLDVRQVRLEVVFVDQDSAHARHDDFTFNLSTHTQRGVREGGA
jgi:hypothetical protein